ncbi:MAG: phospholipid transport system substrate-binding protein, partial [Acetobacteraceae bacterium]|nr:phospholipid transport system substrate-binding protein [Acetobacteraceae bacterium]
LFHEVLVTNITSKLGEYKGVTFTMGRARPQDDEAVVSTTVVRPNNAPTAVDWIIANPTSQPKIIDVVAEGTSLRLTQRQDYASYLAHNNNNVDALIAAMKNQISQNSQGA